MCALGPAPHRRVSHPEAKFSVHEFWDDVHRWATRCLYVGELCRYLLNAPTSRFEHDHRLRAITGNGLRPEIWAAFQQRFAISKIVEFYGATEGNVSMLNYDGKVGAVGRIPFYMRAMMQTRIVRFDIESETPVRGADGHCIECGIDEVGEVVGKISGEPGRTFDGYTKKADTEKKVLRNVFQTGDSWFRTGDLMRRDALGYFYFVDRIGDTFRWKGENVATSEVAEALSVVAGVREIKRLWRDGFRHGRTRAWRRSSPRRIRNRNSPCARWRVAGLCRPVFVRLLPAIEITGTFKQRR